jgi:pimeloyl-ACP methyl ester carboxylesterase
MGEQVILLGFNTGPHQHVTTPTAAQLTLPEQILYFHRLAGHPERKRKLLLLHGTAIDGLTTWGLPAHYFKEWNEVLIPDLRGVGKTRPPDGVERPFTTAQVVADLQALVTHCGWEQFDLAGYSYGGTIAMLLKQAWPDRVEALYLLEPALLGGSSPAQLAESRVALDTASQQMLSAATVDQGIATFMNAIIPAHSRQPARAKWLYARLHERPQGVAYCIRCTNEAIRQVNLDDLLPALSPAMLLTGALSAPGTRARADLLAREYGWSSVHIEGADHGLPMQKPRAVAQAMNDFVRSAACFQR